MIQHFRSFLSPWIQIRIQMQNTPLLDIYCFVCSRTCLKIWNYLFRSLIIIVVIAIIVIFLAVPSLAYSKQGLFLLIKNLTGTSG